MSSLAPRAPKNPNPFTNMQQLLEKQLKQLAPANYEDLCELWRLLGKAENDEERSEIVKTIMEIVFPETLQEFDEEDVDDRVDAGVQENLANYRINVGLQIKRYREMLHLTQAMLAEKAGIPQSHVSRLERGVHVPTFITMEKIAQALGKTPGELDPGYA